MNKTDTELKKDVLKILNDMAKKCDWKVFLTDDEKFKVLNSTGNTIYISEYPTDVAFYISGTKKINVFN